MILNPFTGAGFVMSQAGGWAWSPQVRILLERVGQVAARWTVTGAGVGSQQVCEFDQADDDEDAENQ